MKYAALLKSILNLAVQKVTPVRKKRLVFTSFNGHYSDNPKYISQKIHELHPSVEIVWLVKRQYMQDLPDYVKAVDIDDAGAVRYYRGSARAIIDNVYGGKEDNLTQNSRMKKMLFRLNRALKNKKGQEVFTTWHGTPLKRMGRDQIGNCILDFSCPRTTMLLGNQFTLDIMRRLTFDKLQMKLIGTPRNDILFSKEEDICRIKASLGLPGDKKVVLYAPTFRSDGDIMNTNIQRSGLDQMAQMDPDRLFSALNKRFGGDWVLVCRFHYHVESQIDWQKMEREYPGRFINGNLYDDMAQYLACADVLLTDASSSMYDYALTGRPCFLFFPDLDYYANEERGFYTPIQTLPFPCAVDFHGLLERIEAFDSVRYKEQVGKMLADYGFVDDADSAERIANYIFAQIR